MAIIFLLSVNGAVITSSLISDALRIDDTVLLDEKSPVLDRSLTESRAWREVLEGDLVYFFEVEAADLSSVLAREEEDFVEVLA